MISFENDYSNGAHPMILRRLTETNGVQSLPYGFDEFCENAKQKIREACEDDDAEIFFQIGRAHV